MKNLKLFLALTLHFMLSLLVASVVYNIASDSSGSAEHAQQYAAVAAAVWMFGGLALASSRLESGVLNACGIISAAITTDCNNLPTPGIQPVIRIANKSDIASYTLDATNPTLLTGITMNGAAKFFKYTGIKKIGKTGMKTIKGKYKNFAEHNGEIAILQNDPTTKKEIDNLLNANCVIIVENKSGGALGNRKYEVYGLEAGLDCEVENDKDNADTQGGYLLKFKTPDGETEPHIPATLFNTDITTTETDLATITAP